MESAITGIEERGTCRDKARQDRAAEVREEQDRAA
jgi:hypothetical protein